MSELNREQLVEAIESAETKEELAAIAEANDLKVNKQGGIETVRGKLLEAVESLDDDSEVPDGDSSTPEQPDEDNQIYEESKARVQEDQALATRIANSKIDTQVIDHATANFAEDNPKPTTRTLVNTKTGRRFAWTAALSKLAHMREE